MYGLDADLRSVDEIVPTSLHRDEPVDDIERLVAAAFTAAAERSLQRAPKREYRRFVEERTTIAGRALWAKTFSRQLALAVPCELYMFSRPDARAAASAGARGHGCTASREEHPRLTSTSYPCPLGDACDAACHHTPRVRQRTSKPYWRKPSFPRASPSRTRALARRNRPRSARIRRGALSWRDLRCPGDFERTVMRFLDRTLIRFGLQARYQRSVHATLFDGSGRRYKVSRPDIQLFDRKRCVAILDCKYKPRYMSRSTVSSADVYQVLFYGEAARRETAFR